MIRLATENDLEGILAIYDRARAFMRSTGNMHQWNNNYPNAEVLLEDISLSRLFVFEEDEELLGVFVYFVGADPTYKHIDGAWLSTEPYGVIHRIANGGKLKGMVKSVVDFADTKHLRIDTHEDNTVMQHVLEKLGFKHCGTIYLENGDPRLAYELI